MTTGEPDLPGRRRRPRSLSPSGQRGHWGHRLLIGIGLLLMLGVVAWQVNATRWTTHSERVGQALIRQARVQQASVRQASESGSKTCTAVAGPGAEGLLEIPAIGLVAPVEQGTADAELNVAVGHDPSSAWPGIAGNAILEAHDVSYFVNIDRLRPGDTIRYATPCATYVFSVQGHQIVKQGSPVNNTATPTVTLVTCWPTNALWFTPNRYVVSAAEVQVQRTTSQNIEEPGGSGVGTPPSVPAPAALVAGGLTLTTYSVPMGTLTIAGTPSPTWVESPTPLADEAAAVEAFIAGVRSTTQDQSPWWSAIAPGVTIPGPLVGADNPAYLSPLDVTITAAGDQAGAVQLTTDVSISGGSAPGHYAMVADGTITNGSLVISGWALNPD